MKPSTSTRGRTMVGRRGDGAMTPVKMSATQGITWACEDYNDTGNTLTFGESAQSNVMCIYVGQYYPASTTSPDVIYDN